MEGFIRARTPEQFADRRNEIIRACESIYLEGGFDAVSFKAISERTSFTRSSIYNYYKTKEEVMLDLLRGYLTDWLDAIESRLGSGPADRAGFCRTVAAVSGEHERMFLVYTDLKQIEDGSRLEVLVEFKKVFKRFTEFFEGYLKRNFRTTAESRKSFVNSLILLFYGAYPLTHSSEKQIAAMAVVGMEPVNADIEHLFLSELDHLTECF